MTDPMDTVIKNLTRMAILLNEHRDLLEEASYLLDNARNIVHGSPHESRQAYEAEIELWQNRKEALLNKPI